MAGREPVPPGRGENGAESTAPISILPGTVVAAHLASCASELAYGARVSTIGELADVLDHLIVTQQAVSDTLGKLAARLAGSPVSAAPSAALVALTDVLRAAATGTGYAADALSESKPLMGSVAKSLGERTHL